jgi:hypothetical protein
MRSRRLIGLILGQIWLATGLEAQYYRARYPSGRIFAELTYSDTTTKSGRSIAVDSVKCSARLDFFPNGWMKYAYSYTRVSTQTWDFSHLPPYSKPYQIDQRRVSYYSGDIEIPTDRYGTVTGPMQATRRVFSDSAPGNQQFIDRPDSSFDFVYQYPGRTPLIMLDEEIHIGWDGRRYVTATRGWQQASAHCDPYIQTWVQQTGLRSTKGTFTTLTGSVDKTIPGTTHRVRVLWSLERPGRQP